tara:strand:- start:1065 stop:1391 length:327 start_codon:yes stop_codon:yes gene_type:complete
MIEQVTKSEFVDRFVKINREDNFTYWGRIALFEYFQELEDGIGEQIEFDPITICCEYTQYANLDELNEAYGKDFKDLDEVRDYTQVIEVEALNDKLEYVDGGFIVQDW